MNIPEVSDFAELINANRDGWVRATGLHFVRATADEVIAEWEVGPVHLQAYGIVHGGVHCGVAETVASVGAALWAMPRGLSVVGLENHTAFLRAVRQGRLRATGKPLARGRKTHLWEVNISDEEGRLVASGRVRLLCLDATAKVAGSEIEITTPVKGPPEARKESE